MSDYAHKTTNNINREKSYYQMRCDFYEKFKDEIKPKLSCIEKNRKKKLSEIKFLYVGAVFVCLFAIFIFIAWIMQFFRLDTDPDDALFLLFIFMTLFICSIAALHFICENIQKRVDRIKERIKKLTMQLSVSCYNDLKWYCNTYRHKDKNDLLKSLVIPSGYTLYFDDIFEGTYKNIQFEMIECYQANEDNIKKIGQLVETHEKRYYGANYFAGVVIKVKMNKNFNGHTVVLPDCKLHSSFDYCRLKHTILEDVEFEKKFNVHTNDEIEARYLLTPSFMEKLLNLKTAFSAKKISCAFYDSNLYIALYSNRNLFEISSLWYPVDEIGQYEQIHNEIISIYKLIDYFKLNEKTGL